MTMSPLLHPRGSPSTPTAAIRTARATSSRFSAAHKRFLFLASVPCPLLFLGLFLFRANAGAGGGGLFLASEPATTTTTAKTTTTETAARDDGGGEWRCCVDGASVNPVKHPSAYDVEDPNHHYGCPDRPSNFSYYYHRTAPSNDNGVVEEEEEEEEALSSASSQGGGAAGTKFDLEKWRNRTLAILGDSTSRQMYEQCQWEFAAADGGGGALHPPRCIYADDSHFLFRWIKVGDMTNVKSRYRGHDILDLRQLAPSIVDILTRPAHGGGGGDLYVVLNVAEWFEAHVIGHVIDENGTVWDTHSGKGKNWVLVNNNSTSANSTAAVWSPNSMVTPPWLRFENLVERALAMMLDEVARAAVPRQVKIVWRSESKTDCNPIGHSFRAPVRDKLLSLQRQSSPATNNRQDSNNNNGSNSHDNHDNGNHNTDIVSILNISQATCQYSDQNPDDTHTVGPHLCFPSVVLRHWLLQFQEQFLS